jgi:hypothetical protein
LLAPPIASAGTLDQQQTDTSAGNSGVYSTQTIGQTFTPGLTGGLDQISISRELHRRRPI